MTLLDRPRTEHQPMQRRDALPERANYADEGCRSDRYGPGHPSCLECPMPECKYEVADPRIERDRRVFELRKRGVPTGELARQFRVSTRTVYRIVQNGGESPETREGAA